MIRKGWDDLEYLGASHPQIWGKNVSPIAGWLWKCKSRRTVRVSLNIAGGGQRHGICKEHTVWPVWSLSTDWTSLPGFAHLQAIPVPRWVKWTIRSQEKKLLLFAFQYQWIPFPRLSYWHQSTPLPLVWVLMSTQTTVVSQAFCSASDDAWKSTGRAYANPTCGIPEGLSAAALPILLILEGGWVWVWGRVQKTCTSTYQVFCWVWWHTLA